MLDSKHYLGLVKTYILSTPNPVLSKKSCFAWYEIEIIFPLSPHRTMTRQYYIRCKVMTDRTSIQHPNKHSLTSRFLNLSEMMNNSQSYCKDSSKKRKVYKSCFSLYKKPLLGDFIRRFSSKLTTNALVILLEAWCFNNTIIYLQTSATRNGNRWFYVWTRSITKLCFLTQCGLVLHAIIRGVLAYEFLKITTLRTAEYLTTF